MGQFEIVPPSEIAVRSGEDLRIAVAELGTGTARIFRIEYQEGGPFESSSSDRITAAWWSHSLPAGVVRGRAARADYQMDSLSVVIAGS